MDETADEFTRVKLLEDPELVERLNNIEKTGVGAANVYCSRQSAVEFCRMMWQLSQQEGTNPFKEMKLLEELVCSPEFRSVFGVDDLIFKVAKIDRPGHQGHTPETFMNMLVANYESDSDVKRFCEINQIGKQIKFLVDYDQGRIVINDPKEAETRIREIESYVMTVCQAAMPNSLNVSIIDLGGGNGDKASLLIKNLPFPTMTYFDVDISSYMGTIALRNLEGLTKDGIEISRSELFTKSISRLQSIISLNDEERVNVVTGEIKRLAEIAGILEKIQKLPETADLTYYAIKEMFLMIREKADEQDKKRVDKALRLLQDNLVLDREGRVMGGLTREKHDPFITTRNFCESELGALGEKYLSGIIRKLNAYHINDDPDRDQIRKLRRLDLLKNFTYFTWDHVPAESIRGLTRSWQSDSQLSFLINEVWRRESLSKYLVDYFNELARKIKEKDFDTVARMHPRQHIDALWPKHVGVTECYWCGPAKNKQILLYTIFGPELEDEEREFGPKRLDKEEFLLFGKDSRLTSSAEGHKRALMISDKIICLDFWNLDDVCRTINSVAELVNRQKIYLLLGQTLGNYSSDERSLLVSNVYANLQPGDFFLVGVDMAPDCRTSEARSLRLEQMKNEYCKGEDFVRAVINSRNAHVEAVYDEQANDVVIHVENEGQRKEFFRSHKFSHQEINGLLADAGFNIIGSRYYTNPRDSDFGLEYAVLLCQKMER